MKNIDTIIFTDKLPMIVDFTSDFDNGIEYKLKSDAIVAKAAKSLLCSIT